PRDTHSLRPDAHVRIAFAKQLVVKHGPVHSAFTTARHVEPFHEDDAVESGRLRWIAREHSDLVGSRGPRGRVPDTVRLPLTAVHIRAGSALEEELLLHIASRLDPF